jgi:Ca2+-binding RTX toxin-like protein
MAYIYGTAGPDQITPSYVSSGVTGFPTNYPSGDSDTLWGGLGQDYLTGGPGADAFVFFSVSESPAVPPGVLFPSYDTISDFNPWEGDSIDLSAIDADENWWATGNQAFSASQLSFDPGTGVLTADVYGGSDLQINVSLVGSAHHHHTLLPDDATGILDGVIA